MRLLLGFDFGTSYFKAGLFDPAGGLRGLGRVRVPVEEPQRGRRELRVDEFWRSVREALAQALQGASASPADIAGLSYASQANTYIALDGNDAPLTPLILWTDRRAAVAPADAAFSETAAFQQAVGFAGLSPESAVTKWRWLQDHEPATWQRTRRLMTLSDYFGWSVTGELAGDASTAALLGLYHLGQHAWWPAALQHFDIERTRLSTPLRPGTASGRTTAEAARLAGLPAGIPFAVGALDHHAAAIGAGVGTSVDGSMSIGTVLAVLGIADDVRPMANCFHGPHVDGRYFRLAFDPAGAGELEDFQRRHAPGVSLEQLVAQALPGGSAAARAAATETLPPHASEPLRAIFQRIGRAHADLVRAVDPGRGWRAVAAAGGGARSVGGLQVIAEATGLPIVAPSCTELASLGAAVLAAVAAGVHPDFATAGRAMVPRGGVVVALGAKRVGRS